ncbi:MAG: hypothetical protein JWO05_3019 [Gemmatimonadetes bacterium]|nr:hypothetical protein [Gemmatimonadota bacterium]
MRIQSRLLAAFCLLVPIASARALRAASTDIAGSVTDSVSGRPLGSAQVSVMQGARVVLNTTTDDFGRYRAHNLDAGTYTLSVHALGFRPEARSVVLEGSSGSLRADFRMTVVPVSLSAVEVRAGTPLAVNTRTGDQVFKQDDYHGSPTSTTSQILQQTIAGAARAPTGEVHIRGQHAEYTYYVDGVPVPSGVSGSLNELFDPEVVNEITFQTGGWDAEFGNKNAAIVNVATKIPSGGFHMDVSGYGGSFASSGQALSMSTNSGRLGMFISGSHQATDMRREPVAFDTMTFTAVNIHNHGEDLFTFGKLSWSASNTDVVNLDVNWSRTRFAVPYDPLATVSFDDHQQDVNSFANLGWRHAFHGATGDSASGNELFVGMFARHGSLDYTPGIGDEPQFFFYPDSSIAYSLSERRSFITTGIKLDYLLHLGTHVEWKSGTLLQRTTGNEDFGSVSAAGTQGPGSVSGLSGSDLGGYTQVAFSPVERVEVRTGVRFDAHTAPFAGRRTQWSPRIRLNLFPGASTTIYGYYGRQFVPTNVEELRTITNVAIGGADAPTVPERDDFFEAGIVHRFSAGGLVAKLSGYHKLSTPGLDDATIPGTAIVTSVNIDHIVVNGMDAVLEIRPRGPLSGYLNASVIHAYGRAPITGGFLPSEPPSSYFDLDHDQRISLVGSGTWSAHRLFVSATTIYGSGLTNGATTDDLPTATFGTGLFDMNSAFKVDPSTVVSVSAGYTLVLGGAVVRPQVYVDNLFDHHYLLKGAFFSGASVGRPRSIQLRVNVGL